MIRPETLADFLLLAKRNDAIAPALFERAISLYDAPEQIAIDKSGANTVAIVSIQAAIGITVVLRESKYLNNIVEQKLRAVKRVMRWLLGFKAFRCARIIITGIEMMHMVSEVSLEAPKTKAPP